MGKHENTSKQDFYILTGMITRVGNGTWSLCWPYMNVLWVLTRESVMSKLNFDLNKKSVEMAEEIFDS